MCTDPLTKLSLKGKQLPINQIFESVINKYLLYVISKNRLEFTAINSDFNLPL